MFQRPFYSHCECIFDIRSNKNRTPYLRIEGIIKVDGNEFTFEAKCDHKKQFLLFLEEWKVSEFKLESSLYTWVNDSPIRPSVNSDDIYVDLRLCMGDIVFTPDYNQHWGI